MTPVEEMRWCAREISRVRGIQQPLDAEVLRIQPLRPGEDPTPISSRTLDAWVRCVERVDVLTARMMDISRAR